MNFFFFTSRRRHTRCSREWSKDVCSSDLRRARRLHHPGANEKEPPRHAPHCFVQAAGYERIDVTDLDRKSTRLNSSHGYISHAVFCLKKKLLMEVTLGRSDYTPALLPALE